jgi:hypothetical protein
MEPEAAPLRRDLAAIGLPVASVWDLVNTSAPYPEAVPILLRHLATARHPVVRQGLARALTVREAKGVAGPPIVRELKHEENPETRWTLANALPVVATAAEADDIAALIADPNLEDVRDRLAKALRKPRPASRSRRGAGKTSGNAT